MTAMLDVTPKTTEQNRIVRNGKSEAEVTNNVKSAQDIVLLKLFLNFNYLNFVQATETIKFDLI